MLNNIYFVIFAKHISLLKFFKYLVEINLNLIIANYKNEFM